MLWTLCDCPFSFSFPFTCSFCVLFCFVLIFLSAGCPASLCATYTCKCAAMALESNLLHSLPFFQHPLDRNRIYGSLFVVHHWQSSRLPFPMVRLLKLAQPKIVNHAKLMPDLLATLAHRCRLPTGLMPMFQYAQRYKFDRAAIGHPCQP